MMKIHNKQEQKKLENNSSFFCTHLRNAKIQIIHKYEKSFSFFVSRCFIS